MAKTRNQRYKADGPLVKLARAAEKRGWLIDTSRPHVQWISPSGEAVVTASTRGGGRGMANHIARLRKAGLTL